MILIYLLKVSACTAIFFALYQFLLLKLTFFNLNRAYLILMLFFSFTIPALTIESKREVVAANQYAANKAVYSNEGTNEKDFVDGGNNLPNFAINWKKALEYTYFSVFAFCIVRLLFMFGYIKRQLRKHVVARKDKVLLVSPQSAVKNCSFLGNIIIDSSLPLNERLMVTKHESVHVVQLHAVDKVLVNLIAAVLWFNPIIYFWRNAIDHNHEFLADQETSKVTDKKIYASLLLHLAGPAKNFAINSFSKLPLKNRIMMLYKEPNSKLKKLTYFLVFPAILICSVAFINRKEIVVNKAGATNQAQTNSLRPGAYGISYFQNAINVDSNGKKILNEADMILVVDAGHGGKDDAITALDGQKEKDLNLRAVKILKEEAAKRGIKVILTRSDDQFLTLKDRLPKGKATAFISIHHNTTLANQVPSNGIEVYVSKQNSNIKVAENLGVGILDALSKLNGIAVKDSLKDANLFLLRESKVPAVLIELGNISDESNLKYVSDEKNLRVISNLILDGFVSFVKSGC